ncbi:MAG: pyrroline-5-carboxylate reductase [Ahrensia sp.]|nr:pyrroline-5-carboxylate reductase [Ahrensia sp.]
MTARLCLVGAGNMGGAMLGGWLADGYEPSAIEVIDPLPSDEMKAAMNEQGVRCLVSPIEAVRPDILIVAVKPQIIGDILPALSGLVDEDNLLLSVAAGTTINSLAAPFAPSHPRIVRVMPNTPAMVGCGMSVCVANSRVDASQKSVVTSLLSAIGEVAWVEEETLMDAVTGVSGSGPAYVFHLAEALANAGVAAGLPPDLAAKLASATVSGAGELMRQSHRSPADLRENVTSPNGTTAAALDVLMSKDGLAPLLERAVAAATERSRELAKAS